jgi:uncharacterized protein DUF5329
MNGPFAAVLYVALGVALAPLARAAPPAIAQTEINYLLGFIENSACEFFRNGSWYDGKKAAAHLRDKYAMLSTGDRIQTAADFIEEAATKSSLSGQPYQVRCGGATAVATSEWLRDILARYRARTGLRAPRAQGVVRLGLTYPGPDRLSVVLPDLNVAVNRPHVLGVTRNGHGLVRGFLGSGAAGQPYDSILVGIHMNAPQAGYVVRSELGLDRHRDSGILHECSRVRTVRIGVLGDHDYGGREQRAEEHAADCKCWLHVCILRL